MHRRRGDTLEVTAAARSPLSGLTLAWAAAGGATVGTPADSPVAPAPGGGHQRTSTVAVSCTTNGTLAVTAAADSSTETVTADVECAEPPDPCDTPLGVLPEGTTTRSGTIEAGGCRTTRRWWGGHQVSYARNHTFTLTAPATVGIELEDDAANDPPLNTYVLLTETHDPHTGRIVARHGTWSSPNHSRITNQQLDAGDYTIIATTVWVKKTGSYNLTINTAYDNPAVAISGLDDTTETPEVGDDSAIVEDRITVSPAGARCRATPAGAVVVSATVPPGPQRRVVMRLAADSTVPVEVTCTDDGEGAVASATFAANAAPEPEDCDDPLGTLADGAVTRSGTLSAGSGCLSVRHHDYDQGDVYYANRHTFRMAAAGWVTIALDSASPAPDGIGPVIDPYVILLNGHSPGGAGTALEYSDSRDSTSGALIEDRLLVAGQYTIEATTKGDRDAGNYRLTVTADYTPRIVVPFPGAGQPERLYVINGTTRVTDPWSYEPASARVSVASVEATGWRNQPEGLDAAASFGGGDAWLTLKPSVVGVHDVTVHYANGDTGHSEITEVWSYCPDGQIALPAGCGAALDRLKKGGGVVHFYPPNGYERPSWCIGTPLADSRTHLWCRRVEERRTYLLKSDPRIHATGEPIVTDQGNFGRILIFEPEGWETGDPFVALEGCQEITSRHWQCDYYSDQMFQAESVRGSLLSAEYLLPALRKGVLDPLGKSTVCAGLYLRAKYLPSPQATAAALGACAGAAVPPSE